jgi:Fungal protein kinase
MSIEALTTNDEDFIHHPRHDLESILYVIFYICTFTKGPGIPRTAIEITTLPLRKWFSHEDPKDIGVRKIGHMTNPEADITNHFTNYWADFAPFALQLVSVGFPGKMNLPNQLTHKRMLEILQKAYAKVEEVADQGLDMRKRQYQGDDHHEPTKRGKRIVEKVE